MARSDVGKRIAEVEARQSTAPSRAARRCPRRAGAKAITGRAAILHLRGDQADHAGMPARVEQHERRGQRVARGARSRHERLGFVHHLRCCSSRRSPLIASSVAASSAPRAGSSVQQAFDAERHVFEPARGIQPRREREADVGGVTRASSRPATAASAVQPAQRRPARMRRRPGCDQHAVVRIQRHEVGDRADRDEVEQHRQIRFRAGGNAPRARRSRAQGQQQVEHHADAGERLARERVARAGSDSTIASAAGSVGARQVVVGDQHAHAARLGRGDARMAGDAVVDGDQQIGQRLGELVDERRRQPVAVQRCDSARGTRRRAHRAGAGRAPPRRCRSRRRNRSRRRRRCAGRAIAVASSAHGGIEAAQLVRRQQLRQAGSRVFAARVDTARREQRAAARMARRRARRRRAARRGARSCARRSSACRGATPEAPAVCAAREREALAVGEMQSQRVDARARAARASSGASQSRSSAIQSRQPAQVDQRAPAARSAGALRIGSLTRSVATREPAQQRIVARDHASQRRAHPVGQRGRRPRTTASSTGGCAARDARGVARMVVQQTTCASLSSVRQRRPSSPCGQVLEQVGAERVARAARTRGSFALARQAQVPALGPRRATARSRRRRTAAATRRASVVRFLAVSPSVAAGQQPRDAACPRARTPDRRAARRVGGVAGVDVARERGDRPARGSDVEQAQRGCRARRARARGSASAARAQAAASAGARPAAQRQRGRASRDRAGARHAAPSHRAQAA